MLENINSFINSCKNIWYTITHPIVIWNWFVTNSFGICMFIMIIGLFSYIFGYKKGAKLVKISIGAYVLILCINEIIKAAA